jgi:hypothetical protein
LLGDGKAETSVNGTLISLGIGSLSKKAFEGGATKSGGISSRFSEHAKRVGKHHSAAKYISRREK